MTRHFIWKYVKHSIVVSAVAYFENIKLLDTIISPGEFIAWRAILQSIYKWSLSLMKNENESASDAWEAKSLNGSYLTLFLYYQNASSDHPLTPTWNTCMPKIKLKW